MLIEDRERLDKIDRLYSLRLDRLISLPVLVVVGDQSSGKSSVLEALTGLPFPRDSALCTRFPTQIVFRRAQENRVDVSISPATEAGSSIRNDLGSFASKWSKSGDSLRHCDLLQILKEASNLMGLNGTGESDEVQQKSRSFSHDLLKIELSGPAHDHFSVVDLPGLFRKPTEGQTTKEDMSLVRNMVSSHLRNDRSIVMAVVPANVDIATQEIIQMAEDADPDRHRTLGVLTKPDLVDKGAEEQVIKLVNNTSTGPGLGYVMVCNRSQRDLDITLAERNANERAFFANEPWKQIPPDRVGIQSLKARLSALVVGASRRSFGEVRSEIVKKLHVTKKKIDALGLPRQTAESERIFLLQTASQYQSLINKATDAHYGRDECFHENTQLRLATLVTEESEKFSTTLAQKGWYHAFRKRSDSDSDDEETSPPSIDDGNVTLREPGSESGLVGALKIVDSERREFPELQDLVGNDTTEPMPSEEAIETWIAREHRQFRGFEVGSINPSLITALVRRQMDSWQYYSNHYVLRIIKCIHRCIHDLLLQVCSDRLVHHRLWNFMKLRLTDVYQKALEHTAFLVNVERGGYPITLNHYFAQTIIKRRQQRMEKALRNMKAWETSDDKRQPLLRLTDVLTSLVSNSDQEVEELVDVLQSYHKVARKRFVDAVAKQVVDHTLICSETAPLHVYSPEFVGKMTETDLHKIAGEDDDITQQRQQLMAEAEILEEGSAILR